MKAVGTTTAALSALAGAVALNAFASAAFPTTQATAQTQQPPSSQARSRPNILFILVDDMGYADLSITGNTAVRTPHIDQLARDGAIMTQFYDPAPICPPSRAGFFTGQFPARNRFWNYIHGTKPDALVGQADWLDLKVPTIARAMRDAGYATAHIGKWHMGGTRDIVGAPPATAYGFDEAFTNEGGGVNGSSPAADLAKSDRTRIYVDKVLDFAMRNSGKPWFVQLWTNDVHEPWQPNAEQLAAVDGKGGNQLEASYFATVVALDRQVGRLVAALREARQLDNTLIILTSDNGPTARKRFYRDGKSPPGSTQPFRGHKNSLYEGGVRQPLIVRWPGHVPAGTRDTTTVAHGVDLFPTLSAIAGARGPAMGDGINLMRAWQGTPIAKRPDLYWTYGAFGPYVGWTRAGDPHDRSPGFAIRSGRWKLLAEGDGTRAELYDIDADPSESRNLAAEFPSVTRALMPKLLKWVRSLPEKPSLSPPTESGATDTD